MSNVITKPGPHRERQGGKARVSIVDRETGTAFGYDSLNRATAWSCDDGRTGYGFSIAGEWQDPAFSVGDLVLVNCPGSNWDQHYGTVQRIVKDRDDEFAVLLSNGDDVLFETSELTRVTIPAPLPSGYRLLPRNVKPVDGDLKYGRGSKRWIAVGPWLEATAEHWDWSIPEHAPHFFASPIPVKAEPAVEEKWRRLAGSEVIEDVDQFAFECDTKDIQSDLYFISARTLVGSTPSEVDATYSSCGPRIFRTRRPLPVVTPEKWEPTCELRLFGCFGMEVGAIRCNTTGADGWGHARLEQRWTCATKEEWRKVEVRT